MKSTAILLSLLLPGTASESSLRGSDIEERELAYATRKEGWLAAHNTRRSTFHSSQGVATVPLVWSAALKREAATLAKSMRDNNCEIAIPPNMVYGINAQARMMYPNLPTTQWAVNQWEEGSRGYTQTVWKATEYVGCADAFKSSDVPSERCSVSVCLYAKVRGVDCVEID
jgi:hypothetical protein